jgi:hypothetical protein
MQSNRTVFLAAPQYEYWMDAMQECCVNHQQVEDLVEETLIDVTATDMSRLLVLTTVLLLFRDFSSALTGSQSEARKGTRKSSEQNIRVFPADGNFVEITSYAQPGQPIWTNPGRIIWYKYHVWANRITPHAGQHREYASAACKSSPVGTLLYNKKAKGRLATRRFIHSFIHHASKANTVTCVHSHHFTTSRYFKPINRYWTRRYTTPLGRLFHGLIPAFSTPPDGKWRKWQQDD